jgi:phosphosulfolactate phosphohydrolase-like enzyme
MQVLGTQSPILIVVAAPNSPLSALSLRYTGSRQILETTNGVRSIVVTLGS